MSISGPAARPGEQGIANGLGRGGSAKYARSDVLFQVIALRACRWFLKDREPLLLEEHHLPTETLRTHIERVVIHPRGDPGAGVVAAVPRDGVTSTHPMR